MNAILKENIALPRFPTTRYQGSKRKVLAEITCLLQEQKCESIIDLYSGSGIVSLLFRYLGKRVFANDYLLYNQNTASLFLSYTPYKIETYDIDEDLRFLLNNSPSGHKSLVSDNYGGVYFKDSENKEIDNFCQNIQLFDEDRKSLYIYAVGQALIKKRPYNLFHRANLSMRLKDVKRSFGNAKTWETSILEHAKKCIKELSSFPIDNDYMHSSHCIDTQNIKKFPVDYDVVYMDPPYINSKSVPVNYPGFYHFLEGLCRYELFERGDENYPHKPIVNHVSPWCKRNTALQHLEDICRHFASSTLIMSYRSDGVPTPDDLTEVMRSCGRRTEVHTAGEYQYALSKKLGSEELFILSKP